MKQKHFGFIIIVIVGIVLVFGSPATAKKQVRLHPVNKKLVQLGLMPVPKYYPEIPRMTAQSAYSLYLSGKALFVLISSSNQDLVVGGIHLTEDKPPRVDPNKLPLKKGQIVVAYCP